jgi:hypothetical protein
MISISNNSPTSNLSSTPSKNDKSLEHMKEVERQLTSTPKVLAEEKVNISEDAYAVLRQEKTEAKEATSSEDSATDRLIERIKEQIEEVKQKLGRLKHDKSEEAAQQRQQLQLQLNTLNATMLDLLGKKLDAI